MRRVFVVGILSLFFLCAWFWPLAIFRTILGLIIVALGSIVAGFLMITGALVVMWLLLCSRTKEAEREREAVSESMCLLAGDVARRGDILEWEKLLIRAQKADCAYQRVFPDAFCRDDGCQPLASRVEGYLLRSVSQKDVDSVVSTLMQSASGRENE